MKEIFTGLTDSMWRVFCGERTLLSDRQHRQNVRCEMNREIWDRKIDSDPQGSRPARLQFPLRHSPCRIHHVNGLVGGLLRQSSQKIPLTCQNGSVLPFNNGSPFLPERKPMRHSPALLFVTSQRSHTSSGAARGASGVPSSRDIRPFALWTDVSPCHGPDAETTPEGGLVDWTRMRPRPRPERSPKATRANSEMFAGCCLSDEYGESCHPPHLQQRCKARIKSNLMPRRINEVPSTNPTGLHAPETNRKIPRSKANGTHRNRFASSPRSCREEAIEPSSSADAVTLLRRSFVRLDRPASDAPTR